MRPERIKVTTGFSSSSHLCALVFLLVTGTFCTQARALVINFNDPAGTVPAAAQPALREAASLWERQFSNDITVNVDIDFKPLESTILGTASLTIQQVNYGDVYRALAAAPRSRFNQSAMQYLPEAVGVNMYTNNPQGQYYVDANNNTNNTTLSATSANFKALGLSSTPGQIDGRITLNSNVAYDFFVPMAFSLAIMILSASWPMNSVIFWALTAVWTIWMYILCKDP